MNLNIAVVDDMRLDAEKLSRVVQRWLTENEQASWTLTHYMNGEELIKTFEPDKYNLVFMDILMQNLNGIDTARKIRNYDNHALIVFTTTSREFAFDAFPLHPFDYVLKPYDSERVTQVLSEAVNFLKAPDPVINVRVSRSVYSIPLRNIAVVSARDHFVELNLTDGRCLLCSMSFHEVEKVLNDDLRFLLCNRGVIINMDSVSSLTRNKDVFVMKDGSRCVIRVRGRANIIDKFTQYQLLKLKGEIQR
ncbi:MAG: response regulator transcription factor [Synergistaceae bacterium]|nr:response regulator transcription factor [Synergistaceae bacterium]